MGDAKPLSTAIDATGKSCLKLANRAGVRQRGRLARHNNKKKENIASYYIEKEQ